MIDEAVKHTPLEAEFARQIDMQQEQIMILRDSLKEQNQINRNMLYAIKQVEKRMPRTMADQMESIGKLSTAISALTGVKQQNML